MKSFWGDENRYLRIRHTGIDMTGKMAKILIAGFSALVIIIFTISDVGFINLWKAQKRLENVKSEIRRLERENVLLEDRINELKSSSFAVEKIAREKYGYIRPGDRGLRINVIPEKKSERSPSTFLDIGDRK